MSDENLQLTRLCAVAMNHLVRQVLQLGNQALHFDGDDPDQWVVVDPTSVRAIRGSRLVADLEILADGILIVVPNDEDLIRDEHLGEYNRRQYDIIGPGPADWKGDREPALAMLWEIPENLQLKKGERQHIPSSIHARKPRYIRSFH
jgi:hypothetical protein